jgi:hypothetical protein
MTHIGVRTVLHSRWGLPSVALLWVFSLSHNSLSVSLARAYFLVSSATITLMSRLGLSNSWIAQNNQIRITMYWRNKPPFLIKSESSVRQKFVGRTMVMVVVWVVHAPPDRVAEGQIFWARLWISPTNLSQIVAEGPCWGKERKRERKAPNITPYVSSQHISMLAMTIRFLLVGHWICFPFLW